MVQAGAAKRQFWRWHGQLVDFFVAEPEGGADENTPTVLLVHGFGAFAEHWRRNIPALAAEGYKVYACTLPGFGPSEKSPQNYTTALWKAYVRDFVVHVIGKPVVVAGNSIGGVVPANACAGKAPLKPLLRANQQTEICPNQHPRVVLPCSCECRSSPHLPGHRSYQHSWINRLDMGSSKRA